MVSAATIGIGTLFQVGDGADPEVFSSVAEVTEIGFPALTRDSVETSHMETPDFFREFIPGMRNGGEVTLTVNWLPNNATQDEISGLLAQYMDDEIHNYQIVVNDGAATFTTRFPGFITNFGATTPLADRKSAAVTIKVASAPTFI